jgi:hypothetical protein
MWAEVTATFEKDLSPDTEEILIGRLGQAASFEECASHTSLSTLPNIIAQVKFAKLSNSSARLYFRDEARVLKVHIESITSQSLKAIRREIDDSISDMRRLGKSEKSNLRDIRAVIGTSDGAELQEARSQRFGQRFKASATDNVPTKLYIPVATFLASLMLDWASADVRKALLNALVAVVATLIWVVIDAAMFKPEIKYSEV